MVDFETVFYVTLGGLALIGSGALAATKINDLLDPKIHLKRGEVERLSELERELQKERDYLEGFGSLEQSYRYQRVVETLDNLEASGYMTQGWIRSSDMLCAEKTLLWLKLDINDK